jgi:uncharacterized protein (DUF697 family)
MEEKEAQAHGIVMKHVWWASGMGLIPIPLLDMAAISATELKMVKNLADHYGVAFSENRGKALIGALAGGAMPGLAAGTARSLLKFIPGVGTLAGMVVSPALAGASTYALGKVFIQHFESGGTLLDFDPAKMKAYYASQYEEGKQVVADNAEPAADKKTKGRPSPSTA